MISKFIALLDRWIATSSGADRRIEELEALHRKGLYAIRHSPEVDVAPADYCEAAGLPRGTHWPVVVAAVLDEVSNSQQSHTVETLRALVQANFLSQQGMERTLAFMAKANPVAKTLIFDRRLDAA